MMRHHQDSPSGVRQFSQNVPELEGGAKVQAIARLIQQHGQRIALSRDGLDQRWFAASVRSQDGDVLTRANGECNVVKHSLAAQHH